MLTHFLPHSIKFHFLVLTLHVLFLEHEGLCDMCFQSCQFISTPAIHPKPCKRILYPLSHKGKDKRKNKPAGWLKANAYALAELNPQKQREEKP